MPAETHQQGRPTDAAGVAEFVLVLLEPDHDRGGSPSSTTRLADCGLAAEDLEWLWQTVREELAERSVARDLEAVDLDLSMTVSEAAEVMALALGAGGDDVG